MVRVYTDHPELLNDLGEVIRLYLPMEEVVPAETALGRICAMPTVSCPPAIPIVVSGERIGPAALKLFARYGIKNVAVLK